MTEVATDFLPPSEKRSVRGGPVRKSRRGRWRAASLILVHVAVLGHVAHLKLSGSTLTPVEPSEAMATLELGYVNAGFVLFCVLILLTLVFGRFFCGWACHFIAYQDLCSWILKRFGITPRPIRSRLLLFVPLGVAFYMFGWPQIVRLLEGRAFPEFVPKFTTNDLWATLPGPGISVLTILICGFLIVYWLGSKGFCSYGCPYGAFFAFGDKFAVGRIRVTDACKGCRHCTAACTSNVLVHKEVLQYGMVIDSGCMKCMDCISVCPEGALYYGFGKPKVLASKGKRGGKGSKTRPYDFTVREELGMVFVFFVAVFAFRGVYHLLPLLLSVGMAVLCSVSVVTLYRLIRKPSFTFQSLPLRSNGRLTKAGRVLACLLGLYLLCTGHCFFVKYQQSRAETLLAEAGHLNGEERRRKVDASLAHLRLVDRFGLLSDAVVQQQLGEIHQERGEREEAERRLQRAVELAPHLIAAKLSLADLLFERGAIVEAKARLLEILERKPGFAPARTRLEVLKKRGY